MGVSVKYLIILAVFCIGVAFTIFEHNSNTNSEEPFASTKKIMTTLEWQNGLDQWSNTLDVADCSGNTCKYKVTFSSPQICPEEAAEDAWCEAITLSGVATLHADEIEFSDDKSSEKYLCKLTKDDQWNLKGDKCPEELANLTANENRPKEN